MTPPSPSNPRDAILGALARYWHAGATPVARLPIPCAEAAASEPLPPQVQSVALPAWAEDVGVDGKLLVPLHCVVPGDGPPWERTDWLSAAAWYLYGAAERAHEERHGAIHSYALRLKGWPPELWERAWVNRMALLLRRWAAHVAGVGEAALCGPLPAPEIIMTHDVDAIAKTLAIRSKQSAFHLFSAARACLRGRVGSGCATVGRTLRFLFRRADYWCLDRLAALERAQGLRSRIYVYGGPPGRQRGLRQRLLDPAYDVEAEPMKSALRQLHADGWTIGVHLSYNSWNDADLMRQERMRVERALGAPVSACRQHWLRFGWAHTWAAHQQAGFAQDATLGFNDRSGFRNGAALGFRPWDPSTGRLMDITVLPMVLMDSHYYDYAEFTPAGREAAIQAWLDEVRAVRGTATVLWHQRVLSDDYGWGPGFEYLVSAIGGESPCAPSP